MSLEWGRTLTAVITPLDSRGEVDYGAAAELCGDIIKQGCDGVVVCGTTGEAATLTMQEKLQLFARIKAAVGSRGKVIAGVGGNCTRDTVALIRQTEALPVDGYMIITPYYNKPNLAGLVEHFRAAEAASSRQIMVYNVPSRTGLDMSLESYEAVLGSCPGITAVKEASPDMDKASQLTARFPRIKFFSGNDSLTLPMMALGFTGVVSVAANIVPGAMAKMTALAHSGDFNAARHIHNALFPLFKALFLETNPIPVKAALELQGWPAGPTRLPLGAISGEHRRQLADLVKRYKREGL